MPTNASQTLWSWLVNTIAHALNDDEPNHEFTRYTLPKVLTALNDGMAMVAKYRPDIFTEIRVVKLQAGSHQDFRACCGNVLDVMEQTDANGNTIKKLTQARKTTTTAKSTWKKPSCIKPIAVQTIGYEAEYADIDNNLNGRFDIFPPVPCEVEAYVRVKCVRRPCQYTEADMNMPFYGGSTEALAVKHYVLAWMLFGDRYSNASSRDGNGAWHYQQFFSLLGVIQQQEDRIESTQMASGNGVEVNLNRR